ncbi:MAG TPA: hypothetical protein VMH28_12055 [Candidatus Acidoferrales bacterium]|nr:hypothetical protein [Candidatus Acidoferrales bacterium]
MAKRARPSSPTAARPEAQKPAISILERKWIPTLLLCGIALAAYANSFGLDLATDAKVIVGANERIRAFTWDNLRLVFTSDYWWPNPIDVLYRPITILSYLVNYSVLGNRTDAAGYHVLNVLLHAINVLLVLRICRQIFHSVPRAFFAAALWAVHPVGTESVANVSGRADLLAALGVLAGLALYGSAREWTGRRAALGVSVLFALTLFASLSKENGAVLPGLMLLWDTLDVPAFRRQWKQRAPFYLGTAAALVLVFWVRSRIMAARPWPMLAYLGNPLLMAGFWTARFTAIKALGLQVWLMVFPVRLSFDRSYRQIALSAPGDPWAWCALATVLAILAVALVSYRRDRVLYFAIGFMAICILPTSNLPVLIGSILAERFLYLPSIGFAMAAAALAFRVGNRRTGQIVLGVLLALFAARTFARNFDWQNNSTLEAADVGSAPDSYRTHDLLARELYSRDPVANLDRAIREGEIAVEILRDLPARYVSDGTLRHLGIYYVAKGDHVKAASPDQARVWYQKALAVLLRARDASEAAEKEFDRQQLSHGRPLAQRLGSADVYQTLAAIYGRLGQHREALATLRYGHGLNPDATELYTAMAAQNLALNDSRAATAVLLEQIFLEGARPATLYGLQETTARLAGGECAVARAGAGLTVDYGCPIVRQAACGALEDLAGAFIQARQPVRAQEQRDRARSQFGCVAHP